MSSPQNQSPMEPKAGMDRPVFRLATYKARFTELVSHIDRDLTDYVHTNGVPPADADRIFAEIIVEVVSDALRKSTSYRRGAATYERLYEDAGLLSGWNSGDSPRRPAFEHHVRRQLAWFETLLNDQLGSGDDAVTISVKREWDPDLEKSFWKVWITGLPGDATSALGYRLSSPFQALVDALDDLRISRLRHAMDGITIEEVAA